MKFAIFALVLFSASVFAEGSVIGRWKTIDDKTQKPKSVIEITQGGEGLSGKIVELINPTKQNPICEKCEGDKKNRPLKGLEILTGFKPSSDGEEWTDGRVLDPENGKTYKCRLRLKGDGKVLEVRGYIGISMFGRSQTWNRE